MFEKYPKEITKNITFTEQHIATLQDILNFGESYYMESEKFLFVKLYCEDEFFNHKLTFKEFYNNVLELFSNSLVEVKGNSLSSIFRFITSVKAYKNKNSGELEEILVTIGSDLSRLIIDFLEIRNPE